MSAHVKKKKDGRGLQPLNSFLDSYLMGSHSLAWIKYMNQTNQV